VPVVRKHHDLIAACEIGEGFEHHPRAVIVRCHECILQNDRHVDTGGTPNIKRRQPKCKVELIKRAFGSLPRRESELRCCALRARWVLFPSHRYGGEQIRLNHAYRHVPLRHRPH
jgi:hypothetical protein